MSRLPGTDGDKPTRKHVNAYTIGFFHIDIAEVRTEPGKLHLFVAIDSTSNFAPAQLHERASTRIAADVLRALLQAVPYREHAVLTDNGQHFTTPGKIASAPPLILEAMDRDGIFRAHRSASDALPRPRQRQARASLPRPSPCRRPTTSVGDQGPSEPRAAGTHQPSHRH